MHARYYDPEAERFIMKDPVSGSLSNPINMRFLTACGMILPFCHPEGVFCPRDLSKEALNTRSLTSFGMTGEALKMTEEMVEMTKKVRE